MSVASAIREYYRVCGLRGVCAALGYRAAGVPRQLRVAHAKHRYPITLRFRTSDLSVYRDILLAGAYNIPELPVAPRTIVDAGAKIGMAAIHFAERYPDTTIIAIEPERGNYQMLAKNVSPYRNVTTVCAALWNRDGEVNIGHDPLDPQLSACRVSAIGKPVRAMTMPTLIRELGIESIDILKVDVEGAEREIFSDASAWLPLVGCILIETHDRFAPGCKDIVSKATQGFRSSGYGELTLFVR